MGTEFFWFYDFILAAILIGMMFIGAKKGFVRMVLSLCAFAASFVIALMISNSVSGWIYDSFISKPLEQTISTSINDALGDNVVTQIGKIDMEKAKINGKSIDSLELKADKAGKVTVNLGNVNLSILPHSAWIKTLIIQISISALCRYTKAILKSTASRI